MLTGASHWPARAGGARKSRVLNLANPVSARTTLVSSLRAVIGDRPSVKRRLWQADTQLGRLKHEAAELFPILIQPRPRRLNIAITASCNYRCLGCRYGRDFMPGEQLPLPVVEGMLTDARSVGIDTVHFLGGEPLLHRDLPRMIERSVEQELFPSITTNASLLKERVDDLYSAGLRSICVGYYGAEHEYDEYVQRDGDFGRFETAIDAVRQRYGDDLRLQMNYLLARPSCTVEAIEAAWEFAGRYRMTFSPLLAHYSFPYFTDGPDHSLAFTPGDRRAIELVVDQLLTWKAEDPERIVESEMSLRSIPDWAMKGPEMRVPCDAYQILFVAADGTVQLCDVTFKLGNVHKQSLREIVSTDAHRQAARDAFALNCPNCQCYRDSRIQKHGPSRRLYG